MVSFTTIFIIAVIVVWAMSGAQSMNGPTTIDKHRRSSDSYKKDSDSVHTWIQVSGRHYVAGIPSKSTDKIVFSGRRDKCEEYAEEHNKPYYKQFT